MGCRYSGPTYGAFADQQGAAFIALRLCGIMPEVAASLRRSRRAAIRRCPSDRSEGARSGDRESDDERIHGSIEALADDGAEGHRDEGRGRSDHGRAHAGDVAERFHGERVEISEQQSDAEKDKNQVGHEEP